MRRSLWLVSLCVSLLQLFQLKLKLKLELKLLSNGLHLPQ